MVISETTNSGGTGSGGAAVGSGSRNGGDEEVQKSLHCLFDYLELSDAMAISFALIPGKFLGRFDGFMWHVFLIKGMETGEVSTERPCGQWVVMDAGQGRSWRWLYQSR